jgi:hypothetical protein
MRVKCAGLDCKVEAFTHIIYVLCMIYRLPKTKAPLGYKEEDLHRALKVQQKYSAKCKVCLKI